jgi:MFS family permease
MADSGQTKPGPGQGAADATDAPDQGALALSEKQRRELWTYIAVSIVAVELLIVVGALLFGFMSASGGRAAGRVVAFPWVGCGAAALLTPAFILLAVHLADVGLFRAPGGAASEAEWQKHLPERLQKIYRIVKGAPVVVILLGVVLFGVGVLTLEGAFSALRRFGSALAPHMPYIVGGIAAVLCVIIISVVWLHYRTRRLIAEYDFRREILEKTGVIIVDKGSTPLPPGGVGDVPYALVAGEEEEKILSALPPGKKHKTGEDVHED